MRKIRGLVLGLIIGMGVATGVFTMWGPPTTWHLFASNEPQHVVEAYVSQQARGEFAKAQTYLTGEALQRVTHEASRLVADSVVQTDVKVVAVGADFCQVEAVVQTKSDLLAEEMYLTKLATGWKIFSIQSPAETWTSLSNNSVTQEQQEAIKSYTSAVAKGNVQQALTYLAGQARIKASELNVNKTLPAQEIGIVSLAGVGNTKDGVLVLAKETIGGKTARAVSLLYTLAEVGGHWKISDVHTLQM